jgi:hypothetical protein
MTVVGVVAEGAHDCIALEAFLESELPASIARPIAVRHLQPELDATSCQVGGGGWGRVVGWCKDNAGGAIETYFVPLEEGDLACDLILIHLDGDAMADVAPHSSIALPTQPFTAKARLETLTKMVLDWLNPPAARQTSIKFAFPVMHTEAWLMAGLKPNEQPWEQLADCKAPFRTLKTARSQPLREFYRAQSAIAASQGPQIRLQSTSFSAFSDDLGKGV